jgi:hypothetical protein
MEAPDMDQDLEAVIRRVVREELGAERRLLGAVMDILNGDPHQFGTRPCSSCQTITSLVGQSFGCIKAALERKRRG